MIHTPLDHEDYQLREGLLRMSRGENGSDEGAYEVEEKNTFNLVRRLGAESQNQFYPPNKEETRNATTRLQHHFQPTNAFE